MNITPASSPILKRILMPLAVLFFAVAVTVIMIKTQPPPKKEETPKPHITVAVTKVHQQDLHFILHSQGMVIPRTETRLTSEVSGRIIKTSSNFRVGAFVKKNDILIQIDNSDYRAALKSAEAELARVRANLQEEIARAQQAERDWRSLGAGVANDLVLRKPQLAREQANVQSAEAALALAQRNLERTSIHAPYDGLVRNKEVDIGQYVNTGTSVGLLSATEIAEIRLPLVERDFAHLTLEEGINSTHYKTSMPSVKITAQPNGLQQQWDGVICRSEGVIDEDSRVIYLVAEIDDPYNLKGKATKPLLRFGTFVHAAITGNLGKNIVVLPRHSLYNGREVIVINKDNRIEIRNVNIQRTDEEYAYINGGLQEGEIISLTPIENPVNGMVVQIENTVNVQTTRTNERLDHG